MIARVSQKLLSVLLTLMAVACQPTASPTQEAASGHAAFRVAMLLPRSIESDPWTKKGYDGLLLIQQELGSEIAYTENVPEADFEKVFRQYADEEYDFIIGHGNQFVDAAERVAADYPEIDFAINGKYAGNNTNLGSLSMREGEMAYLMGAIAAIKSNSGHVGYIGGADNPAQQEVIALYKRGANAINANIKVTVELVGNYTDTEKAHAIAQGQIEVGVDIILVLAGAAGTPVHAQAEAAGIHTLGWIDDLNYLAPKGVIASNVQDVPTMILRGATQAWQGRWQGKEYRFGLAEGTQYLSPFYGLVTPAEEARINMIKKQLFEGNVDVTP